MIVYGCSMIATFSERPNSLCRTYCAPSSSYNCRVKHTKVKWFLVIYLLTQSKTNVAALELTRHLGVCYRSAWRLKHKLMVAMTEREASRTLSGFVEIDDAYLGGERTGGKPGRGSENKRPFMIAVSTDELGRPGIAVIEPVSGFTRAAIAEWAKPPACPRSRGLQ